MQRRKTLGQLFQGASRYARNLRLVDQRRAFQLWERHILRQLFETCAVDCVFDVGANVGQYASQLRRLVGYKGLIISFEPQPGAVDALRNRAQNDRNWKVEGIALSNRNGTAEFHVAFGSEFSSLSQARADVGLSFEGAEQTRKTVVVQTETLGHALQRLQSELGFKRPFLKLDTQGFDHQIVMGDPEASRRFIGLQSEISITPIYEHSVDYLATLADYQSLGFRLCTFVPNNFGHFPKIFEMDCIMIQEGAA